MLRQIVTVIISLATIVATAQTPQQTAGIYLAYPGPQGTLTEVPDGYVPFYISHYGRHGSRWVTDDYRYTDVYAAFDTLRLTPLGEDVKARLELILDDALGRSGSLSPIGARQHQEIARRMYERFPEVFTDSAQIYARSSTSLRCAMSMAAFLDGLKGKNPTLSVTTTAYPKDMDIIAYTSPAGKEFSSDTAAWRKDYWRYVEQMVKPDRLIQSLFEDADRVSAEDKLAIATGLYWIASDMQDVELDVSLYDIFTYEELQSFWRCINARMYICNGDSPLSDGIMKHCADNLLADIKQRAQSAIDGNGPAVDLRFGHDTHLLRLLALLGIEGATARESDIHRIHEVWQDYKLSPMAANLQIIFYRNAEGDILVKYLLNENEVQANYNLIDSPGVCIQ